MCSNHMDWMLKMALGLVLGSWMAFGQTGISGAAPVTLQAGAADCGGYCVTVEVNVDVTGLVGSGGDAGLNGFVLAFDISRSDVYASARPGSIPIVDWDFVATDRDLVDLTNRLVLVGSVPDMSAPNQNYHVATVVLCGTIGDVTFTLVGSESSLGSRVVAGNGPGPIDLFPPDPFTSVITLNFPLDWGTGASQWMTESPSYDLVAPLGPIDVLDLSQLINCGVP